MEFKTCDQLLSQVEKLLNRERLNFNLDARGQALNRRGRVQGGKNEKIQDGNNALAGTPGTPACIVKTTVKMKKDARSNCVKQGKQCHYQNNAANRCPYNHKQQPRAPAKLTRQNTRQLARREVAVQGDAAPGGKKGGKGPQGRGRRGKKNGRKPRSATPGPADARRDA